MIFVKKRANIGFEKNTYFMEHLTMMYEVSYFLYGI